MNTIVQVKRHLIYLVLFLIIVLFCACSGRKVDPNTREELPASEAVTIDAPEEDLYFASKELYERDLCTVAIDTLKSLINNYPTGQYVEFAKVKLADCTYRIREYQQTASIAQDFVEEFPASTSAPYMYYLAAKSYYALYGGTGRDVEPLLKAQEFYQKIIEKHPNSDFFYEAEEDIIEINQEIAKYQKFVIDYYTKQGYQEAADDRNVKLAKFKEDHLTEMPKRSKVRIAGVSPQEAQPLEVAGLIENRDAIDPELLKSIDTVIASVNCRELPAKIASISFTEISNQEFFDLRALSGTYKPVDGVINLNFGFLEKPSEDDSYDCFQDQQVTLQKSGQLRVITDSELKVLALDHPKRLLLHFID